VTLDVPFFRRLDIDGERVLRIVARWAAARVLARLRAGRQISGAPIPPPRDGGPPLRRTGQLLRSIKARRVRITRGANAGGVGYVIRARGYREKTPDDRRPRRGAKRASNELVFASLQRARSLHLLGLTAVEEEEEALGYAEREIARQLAASSSGGIVGGTIRFFTAR
jgi:hypothetical protein